MISNRHAVLVALVLAAIPFGTALGGPNDGGVLVLHRPEIGLTCREPCRATPDCLPTPVDCSEMNTRVNDANVIVLEVVALFPEGQNTSVRSVGFGIEYDETEVFVTLADPCPLGTDQTGAGWPRSGTGTLVTLDSLGEDAFVPVYYLAAYNYYANPQTMSLVAHPDLGAAVVYDDNDPPNVDVFTDLGVFGFFRDGYLPCPGDPTPTRESSWGSLKEVFQSR